MYVLAEEDAVCGMTRMCCISYTITHQPALITFLLQQDDFHRVQYGVLYVSVVSFFTCNQYKGCSQGTNSSLYGCYTGLWTHPPPPQTSVPCVVTDDAVFTRCVHNLRNLNEWATENPPATRHSSFQRR
jgi:hypothetical protein